jgi:hypothetical protein
MPLNPPVIPPGSASVPRERNWFVLFAENFMHEISGVPGAELFQQIGSMKIDGRGLMPSVRPASLLEAPRMI